MEMEEYFDYRVWTEWQGTVLLHTETETVSWHKEEGGKWREREKERVEGGGEETLFCKDCLGSVETCPTTSSC